MVLGQEAGVFSTNGHASADHARFIGRLVRKRDGRLAPFDRSRIAHAVEMAVRAELGCPYPDPIASAAARTQYERSRYCGAQFARMNHFAPS